MIAMIAKIQLFAITDRTLNAPMGVLCPLLFTEAPQNLFNTITNKLQNDLCQQP